MANSRIEWTNATWNPVTGCTKVSPGCQHCYAERYAHRLYSMGVRKYRNKFELTTHEDTLDIPSHWRAARLVFVNSMSDLFHEDVPDDFIQRAFRTMRQADRHQFQVLTKRADRLRAMSPKLHWTRNIWMGVSV